MASTSKGQLSQTASSRKRDAEGSKGYVPYVHDPSTVGIKTGRQLPAEGTVARAGPDDFEDPSAFFKSPSPQETRAGSSKFRMSAINTPGGRSSEKGAAELALEDAMWQDDEMGGVGSSVSRKAPQSNRKSLGPNRKGVTPAPEGSDDDMNDLVLDTTPAPAGRQYFNSQPTTPSTLPSTSKQPLVGRTPVASLKSNHDVPSPHKSSTQKSQQEVDSILDAARDSILDPTLESDGPDAPENDAGEDGEINGVDEYINHDVDEEDNTNNNEDESMAGVDEEEEPEEVKPQRSRTSQRQPQLQQDDEDMNNDDDNDNNNGYNEPPPQPDMDYDNYGDEEEQVSQENGGSYSPGAILPSRSVTRSPTPPPPATAKKNKNGKRPSTTKTPRRRDPDESDEDEENDNPLPTPKRSRTKKPQSRVMKSTSVQPEVRGFPDDEEDSDSDATHNGVPIRRGRRHRIKPLEYWRGEKLVLGRRESGFAPVPIVKGFLKMPPVEAVPLSRTTAQRKAARGTSRGRSASTAPPPNKIVYRDRKIAEEGWDAETSEQGIVVDYATKLDVERRIAFPQHMIEFKPMINDRNKFKFQKVFGDADFIAAGMLEIPVGGEKPSKPTKDNTYVFYVIEGAVRVKVHRTNFVMAQGGQFMVPRGNQYSLENISKKPARLFFSQARKIPVGEEEEAAQQLGSVQPERRRVSSTGRHSSAGVSSPSISRAGKSSKARR